MSKRRSSASSSTAKASILGSADPILNAIDREIAWLIEYEGRDTQRNGKPSNKRQKLDWAHLATLASEATSKHIRKNQSKPKFQNMATILLIQNHKRKAFRELRERIQKHVLLMSSSATANNGAGKSSTTYSNQHQPPMNASAMTGNAARAVANAKANNALHQRWAIATRSTLRGFFAGEQCSISHLRLPSFDPSKHLEDSAATQINTATCTAATTETHDHHRRVVLHRKRARENKAPEWLVEDPEAPIRLSVRVGRVGVYQNLEAENPISSSHPDPSQHQRRSQRRQKIMLCPILSELAELWFQSERASKTGKVNWINVKDCASSGLREILADAMDTAHFSTNPLEVLVDVKERRRFLAYQAQLENNTSLFSMQRKRLATEHKEAMAPEDGDSHLDDGHNDNLSPRKQYHAPGDVVQFRWVDKKEEGTDQESWVKGVIKSFSSDVTEDGQRIRTYNIKRTDDDCQTKGAFTIPNIPELAVHTDEDATILQQQLPFKGVRVMVDATSSDLYLRRRGWYETDLTDNRVFSSLSHAMRERDDALFRKCRSNGKNQRSVMLNEMNLPDDWQAKEPPRPKPPPPREQDENDDYEPHVTTESVSGSAATTKCEESTSVTTLSSAVDSNSRSSLPHRWSPDLFGALLSCSKERLLSDPIKELAYLLELSKEGNGTTTWSYVMKANKSPELESIFKAGKRSPFWQTQKIKALIGDERALRDAFRLYREKVQEKVQDMVNDDVIDNDEEDEEDDFSFDQGSTRRESSSTRAATRRKCPPWTPELYTNMGVPPELEQVLTKEEMELAYLLEIGRGRSGKFLWEWVLQQDMSPALAKLIDAASSADNQYWERQKLKSLIGCGKVKNEAMKVYREGLKRRLQELESEGAFESPKKSKKSVPSKIKPSATTTVAMSSANSSLLMQELAFHHGQSMFHFGRVEHSYVIAHSSPSLLKHYTATPHATTRNKWNLAPNKSSVRTFDLLCKESLGSAESGTAASTLYLTSARGGPRVQICFLSFEEVVGGEDVVKPERLSPEHVELAFLMEKSAMLNNSAVQWCYVEAHYKSDGLTALWSTKAQLQAFSTNRLQYLVGRNEHRLETFRTARSKLKKMMLQAMGTRAVTCRSGSKRKGSAAVPPSPPTPSYHSTLSTQSLSSSPKRQRKFMRDGARRYMDSLVSLSRSGVVAKAKFANDLLALVRSHHTLKNGKQDRARTSLSSFFKRQEVKLRALELGIEDAVMEHVDGDEDPELEFEATTYLNLRESQFMAFCDQLVQTWKSFEGSDQTKEDLFDELEASQRTLWDYHLRAEEAMLELHTVKISGLK